LVTLNSIDWVSSRTVPVAVIGFSGAEVPLAYCTRFFAKYKGREGARGCGNNDWFADGKHSRFATFSQTRQTSQDSFPNKIKTPLVVVMSAVDWWKSSKDEALTDFLRSGVRWMVWRLLGKLEGFSSVDRQSRIRAQTIRIIPTRSSQVLHIRFV
jgi:hypothetical protein